MRTANEYEIAIFKKEYCKNGEARISIGKDIGYDKAAGKIIVRPECYFDKPTSFSFAYISFSNFEKSE